MLKQARIKSWQGKAVVEEVHDGDTFKVWVDLGFAVYLRTNIRVQGVNAPELPTAEGCAAAAFLVTLLPINTVLTIQSRRIDLHGRAEAIVTLDDGRDLAQILLDAKMAQPANDRGNL
jgi:endonuclease YncB( thermonuclease family)